LFHAGARVPVERPRSNPANRRKPERFIVKKLFIVLAICLAFGVTAAFADGTALYDSKCAKCHGQDGAKVSGMSGGVMLKGQSAADIQTKLLGYKAGSYGGDKKKTMMRMVDKLTEQEISDLADHIGGL
jgi:cytochrome c